MALEDDEEEELQRKRSSKSPGADVLLQGGRKYDGDYEVSTIILLDRLRQVWDYFHPNGLPLSLLERKSIEADFIAWALETDSPKRISAFANLNLQLHTAGLHPDMNCTTSTAKFRGWFNALTSGEKRRSIGVKRVKQRPNDISLASKSESDSDYDSDDSYRSPEYVSSPQLKLFGVPLNTPRTNDSTQDAERNSRSYSRETPANASQSDSPRVGKSPRLNTVATLLARPILKPSKVSPAVEPEPWIQRLSNPSEYQKEKWKKAVESQSRRRSEPLSPGFGAGAGSSRVDEKPAHGRYGSSTVLPEPSNVLRMSDAVTHAQTQLLQKSSNSSQSPNKPARKWVDSDDEEAGTAGIVGKETRVLSPRPPSSSSFHNEKISIDGISIDSSLKSGSREGSLPPKSREKSITTPSDDSKLTSTDNQTIAGLSRERDENSVQKVEAEVEKKEAVAGGGGVQGKRLFDRKKKDTKSTAKSAVAGKARFKQLSFLSPDPRKDPDLELAVENRSIHPPDGSSDIGGVGFVYTGDRFGGSRNTPQESRMEGDDAPSSYALDMDVLGIREVAEGASRALPSSLAPAPERADKSEEKRSFFEGIESWTRNLLSERKRAGPNTQGTSDPSDPPAELEQEQSTDYAIDIQEPEADATAQADSERGTQSLHIEMGSPRRGNEEQAGVDRPSLIIPGLHESAHEEADDRQRERPGDRSPREQRHRHAAARRGFEAMALMRRQQKLSEKRKK
jgi:hypothetical protein